MATTLRDLGLEQRSAAAPAPTLRDFGLTPQAAPDVSQIVDETAANGMGQLRRGYTSGVYGGDANLLAAEQSSLRAAGKHTEADALGQRIAALNNRAATFAPAEQDVTKLGWNPGRILDYGLGAVGQAGASMQDPIAMGVAGNAASNLVSMIPHPAAKAVGLGLRGAGMLGGYYDMARQAKGEFYQDALKDPELMAKTSARDLNDKGNVFGALSGAVDTALPGMIAGRLSGRGVKALSKLGAPAKLAVDAGIESGQELSQEAGKKFALGQLNPNRDTSGDANDYWNSAAGGAFGGAGIGGSAHLVSHLASSAVNRKGVVDDTSSNDVSGRAVPPKNENLTQSMVRAAKENTSGAQEKWHNTLMGVPDENNLDDIDTPINTQHAALTKELTARAAKGDATAQQHLDALSAMQPGSADWYDEGPRSAAATHIMGDGQDHSKFEKAYKERARNMQGFQTVNVGNEEVAVGAPIAPGELGKGKEGGVKIERDSPEMKAAVQERRDVKQRAVLTGRIMSDAVPTDAKPQLKKVAASLGAEIAEFAGSGYQKPLPGDVARVQRMAAQMVYLYGGVKAAEIVKKVAATSGAQGTPLMQAMTASVAAARDTHIFAKQQRVARDTAAQQLVQAIPPRAQLTLHRAGLDLTTEEGRAALLTHVEDFFDGESTRSAMAFNTTFGKHTVEAMRQIVGQRLEPRIEALTEKSTKTTDTAETKTPTESDETLGEGEEDDAARTKAEAEKGLEEAPPTREYYAKGLRNSIPGTKASEHPFVANAKTGNMPTLSKLGDRDADGELTLHRMVAQAYEKQGGPDSHVDELFTGPTPTGKPKITPGEAMSAVPTAQRRGRHPDEPADVGFGSTRIRSISAKEAMDHHRLTAGKRVEILRDYLAHQPEKDGEKQPAVLAKDDPFIGQLQATDNKIATLEKTTPKEISALGGSRIENSIRARLFKRDNPQYAELRELKGQREEAAAKLAAKIGVEYREGMSVQQMADAYFRERYMVVAEQNTERDTLRMPSAEVRRMITLGTRYLKFAMQVGPTKKMDDEQRAQAVRDQLAMEADMNLIRFGSPLASAKDGSAAIPAAELVKWYYDNHPEFEGREYNDHKAQARAYRDALGEAITALLASGKVDDGLPYIINKDGDHENFTPSGLPPSLKLGGMTQGNLAEADADKAHVKWIDNFVESERKKRLSTRDRILEARSEYRKQERAVIADQEREEEAKTTDAEELLDEGKEHLRPEHVDTGLEVDQHGPRDPLSRTQFTPGAQYWDAPTAQSADEARQRGATARFGGPDGDAKKARVAPFPTAPETVDRRSGDPHRTELDSFREQDSGVHTDFTDITRQSDTVRAAKDATEGRLEGLTFLNAMSRAEGIANSILGMFAQPMEARKGTGKLVPFKGATQGDPRVGFERLQRLVNALGEATHRQQTDHGYVGGKQYAAPLAYLLTTENVAFIVSHAKNKERAQEMLDMMRSQTANALGNLMEGTITKAQKGLLASKLLGTIPSVDPTEGLRNLGFAAETARKRAVADAKDDAAATAKRVAKVTEKRRLAKSIVVQEKDGGTAQQRRAAPVVAKVEAPKGVVLTGKSPYLAKDQAKADKATKFIGRGSPASSTAQYARDFGPKANSGEYTAEDRVFVSAEGQREGRVNPDRAELDKATTAGATIITDDAPNRARLYNVGERQIAKYLAEKGYTETAPGEWTKVEAPKAETEAMIRPWRPEDGEGTELPSRSAGLKGLVHTVVGMAKAGRSLNTQTGVPSEDGQRRLVTRLAAARKGDFASASTEGVEANKIGGDSFGPFGRAFTYYFTVAQAATHTAVVPDSIVPRLERFLASTTDPEQIAKALGFFSVQHVVYEQDTGNVTTFGPRPDTPGAEAIRAVGAMGEANALDGDGKPLTRVEGVSDRETLNLLATALAYSKHVAGKDELPVNWERATGAKKGKTGGGVFNTQATPADIQSPEAASPPDERIAAAKAYIAKVLGPKVTAQFVKDFDAAGEWIKAENLIKLSLTGGPGMMDVAHHEAMHAFFDGLLEHHPKAAEALKNVLGGEAIYERLKGLLANEPTALEQIKNDPAERVAYAFQFWAAGALDVDKPATTMFDKFRKFLRKVLGMVRESETALDIITAFHAGKAADLGNAESPAGRVIKEILARETWNEDVKRKFDTVVQKLHAAVAPSNDVLRREVMSATARELGLMMFTNPGEQAAGGAKEGYINARARIGRQFSNRLYQVLKGLSDRDMLAAIEMLQNGQKPDEATYAPVGAAVKGVYGLLQRYREHALNAGLNLENLGDNYFPRIWDLSKLIEGDGKDQFIAMLMKPEYDEKLATMMAVINANRDVAYTKEEVVSAMHRSLVDRGGVDEQGMEAEAEHDDLILKPFFASSKERHFKWLNREDVTPFLEKDLVGAMSRYLHQGVRAAEFARRFGDGGGKLKAMLKMKGDQVPGPDGQMVDAAEHGPIAAEMEEHLKEKGIEGAEADKIIATHMGNIKQAVAAHEGSIGGDISPTFRKLSSAAMAYQNMRLLPMALFSAVADTAALAARGPGLKGAYEAFVKGLTDVYARWKDAASDTPAVRKNSLWDDIAETVGAVDSHMFLEQMGKAHTSEFMTNFARNANRKLFMLNGLTAWDRSMRVSATKFAVQFLEAHKSLPDAQHSARWLKELGLRPADIHLDGEGKLIWNRNVLQAETGMSQDEATKAMEKTHYAITRWVEGAVLSPNAAQRPSWGSDPRWAVLFHLKQFTYSMQHTVLKRAFNEASEGNMNPIGALAAGIPIMMASDIVKGLVQGGGSLPTWQHGMDLGDRVKMAAQRAGLAGVGQFGIDALHDPAGIFGPTVGQIWKTATNPSDLGSNLIDAVPGLRYVKPAKDLVLGAE